MKPGSHQQLKFPAGWLMQRPWGPHTLEEMCHTPFWVSLGATATVQLSITAEEGFMSRPLFLCPVLCQ